MCFSFLIHCMFVRFNRYMVECELTKIVTSCFGCSSFNRYMVECEYRYLTEKLSNQSGFNRYMVECELHSAF